MYKKLIFSISVLVLSLACTSQAIVVGDFEADLDGWVQAGESTLTLSTIGASSGEASMLIDGPGGWQMITKLDIKSIRSVLGVDDAAVSIDVTAFAEDMQTEWMNIEVIINGQSHDDTGAHNNIGWQSLGGLDMLLDGVTQTLYWEVPDDLSARIAGTDDNIEWFELFIVTNNAAQNTKFYVDNIQILGAEPEAPTGPNIAWVSYHAADDEPHADAAAVGFTMAPDIGYTDLLKANGYNVIRVLTSGTPDVEFLNTMDLVIISRTASSGHYSGEGASLWNSVTAPMINLNGYTLRSSRLGFTDGTDMPDTTGDIRLTVTDPSHPIFAGIALTDGVMDNLFAEGAVPLPTDGTISRGISINNNNLDDEGTVLATIAEVSADTGPVGGIIIAELPAGATMENSSGSPDDVLGGPRLVFLTGSREPDGVTGGQAAALYDLYPDGEKMFLNAVAYMIPGGPVLRLDVGNSHNTEELEEGFISFTLDDSGSAVGGITIEIDGINAGDARRRGDPAGVPYENIYRDFVFGRQSEAGVGYVSVTLSGLEAEQAYAVTLYSWDTSSTSTRIADWTANGEFLFTTIHDGNVDPPAAEGDYAYTGIATADVNGVILMEAVPGEGTFGDQPFAFINALELVPIEPVLKLDVGNSNNAEELEEGFTSFTLDDSGSDVDGITIEIGGINAGDARRRGEPAGVPFENIYRDFVFGRQSEAGVGYVSVTLSGLKANQTYGITLYSWDTSSTSTRIADWTANGEILFTTIHDGNVDPPAAEDDYAYTGIATADENGVILMEAVPGEGTWGDQPFAFINALVVSSGFPAKPAPKPEPEPEPEPEPAPEPVDPGVEGLIAAYSFENDTTDSSGNELHGTIVGDPVFVDGPAGYGMALDFDGDGDYVDCGNSPLFDITEQITVAAWINIRSVPGEWRAVIAKGDNAWRISTNSSTQGLHFGFEDGTRGWQAANSDTVLELNEWHHVCGTYDLQNGARIFIDGMLDGANPDTQGITLDTYNVFIGENSQNPGRFWDGLIDEVVIYDRALSAGEVAYLAGK